MLENFVNTEFDCTSEPTKCLFKSTLEIFCKYLKILYSYSDVEFPVFDCRCCAGKASYSFKQARFSFYMHRL